MPINTENSLKKRIKRGDVVKGGWISLNNASIGEMFARAGCDWVTIDLEHSVIDLAEAQELIRAIDLAGSAPLVRLSSPDPIQIKRVMDAGAHGIIAPNIRSAEETRNVVAAVHYPPLGTRGVGLARAQGFGAHFAGYREWLKECAVVLIQIEHIDAVRDLESIVKVPGLDGFLIGPYDLSASLGRPGDFTHPEFVAALNEIRKVAKKEGIPSGMHVVEPDPLAFRKALDEGHRLIAYSVDIRILDSAMRAIMGGQSVG